MRNAFRALLVAAVLYAAVYGLMFLGAAQAPPPEENWQSWPRRGTVPIAVAGCETDACLEYREGVLVRVLGAEK